MDPYLLAAAIATFATFAIHTWIGGPAIAKPLLETADMHDVAKYTNYYCWHIVTITLFVMAGGFAWAAYRPDGIELAWLSFLLSTAFLVWNLVLVFWKKQSLKQMPQWALFLGISTFGAIGLMA